MNIQYRESTTSSEKFILFQISRAEYVFLMKRVATKKSKFTDIKLCLARLVYQWYTKAVSVLWMSYFKTPWLWSHHYCYLTETDVTINKRVSLIFQYHAENQLSKTITKCCNVVSGAHTPHALPFTLPLVCDYELKEKSCTETVLLRQWVQIGICCRGTLFFKEERGMNIITPTLLEMSWYKIRWVPNNLTTLVIYVKYLYRSTIIAYNVHHNVKQ